MPIPVPNAPPPRPPDLVAAPSDGSPIPSLVANVQTLAAYNRQLIVWITGQLNSLRAAANWTIQQVNIRNLVPDSDIKDPATFWTVGGGWAVTEAVGAGGGRAFTAAGPLTADVTSSPIVVATPGDLFVLSGWLDCRDMTGGTLSWLVKDAFGPTVIVEAMQVNGTFSRLEVVLTVPAGTSQVVVVLRAVGMVTGLTGVIASQPQIEGPIASATGITAPSASLYRTNIGLS